MASNILRAEKALIGAAGRLDRATEARQRAVTLGSSEGFAPVVLAVYDRRVAEAERAVALAWAGVRIARASDPQAAAEDAADEEVRAQWR